MLPVQLAFASLLLLWGRAGAQEGTSLPEAKGPSFWRAASWVMGINGLLWFYNWHVQGSSWANVGTQSWWENVHGGFTWDDDVFGVNQLGHPYHGSHYFNAARSSGYDFWGSTAFAAAGSLTWELFWENVRPSTNDLINTTLGGIALGEVSYRMYTLLSSGRSRAPGRTVGTFVVSPISGAQGLIHDANRRRPFQGPETNVAWVAVGRQRDAGSSPGVPAGNRPFVQLTFQYGGVFDQSVRRPYDAFEFRLQLSPNEPEVLTHASVSGLLVRRQLARSSGRQLQIGLFQHYDYDNLPLTKSSSQSLSGALLYRQTAGSRTHADLGLHLELVALGAVSSEYGLVRRRDYDFGPGIGGRISAALRRDGHELLRVDGRTIWMRTLYATESDHMIASVRLAAAIPLARTVSVGCDIDHTSRRSWYQGQPSVARELRQFRAYLIWSPSKSSM
jgi:Domain of unknown function (DUF3943)